MIHIHCSTPQDAEAAIREVFRQTNRAAIDIHVRVPIRSDEIVFPRPCCYCGRWVPKQASGAVACMQCGANWDSFLGTFGGAVMNRDKADAIAATVKPKKRKK